jgi:predicted  nucleic acid-binding Zn-ribbon protein
MNTQFVPVANRDCTRCGHLVTSSKTFFDSCHYTKGNTQCPAQHYKIGLGVNIEKASTAIAEALFAKDVDALARHLNKLVTFQRTQTVEVLDKVFDKTAVLYGLELEDVEEADSDETETVQVMEIGEADLLPNPDAVVSQTASTPSEVEAPVVNPILFESISERIVPEVAQTPTLEIDLDGDDEWKDDGSPSGV